MRDFALCLLIVLVFSAFAFTSPAFLAQGAVRVFMAMPLYIQITMGLFILCPLGAGILLTVRFFSQDWAGTKMRYEERNMNLGKQERQK